MKQFTGIYPAIVTPYTSEGRVHTASLEKLIQQGFQRGISGFFVCGGTGEGLLLSMEERKLVLEAAVAAAAGKGPIISNIGSFSTEAAIELATHAEKAGAAAVISVPPFYFGFSMDDYVAYYNDLAAAVSLPVMVYNIPAQSHVSFSFNDFSRVFENEQLLGAKLTISDLFLMQRLIEAYPRHSFFSGYDEVFLSALSVGAKASISSTSILMPEKFLEIERCYQAGEMELALQAQGQLNHVIAQLLEVGVIRGVKALLEMQGIPCGGGRKPFRPLTDVQREKLRALLPLL